MWYYEEALTYIRQIDVKIYKHYKFLFFLTLPQRQHCMAIYKWKKNSQLNFTTGKLLINFIKRTKFYKKLPSNLGVLTLHLKKFYLPFLTNIYLFKIKNFCKRQFNFFKKYHDTIHPDILILLHKKSYTPKWHPQKRIKKVILRLLNKV